MAAKTKRRSAPPQQSVKQLLGFLGRQRKSLSPLLILTHDYPDPDALASAFALQTICSRVYGIESRIVYGGVIGRMENREMVRLLKIPAHRLRFSDLLKHEHAALVDTQPEFENNSFPKSRKADLVIDQHPFVAKPDARLAVIDTECGATSVILSQALMALKIEIPAPVATALAYGILSDTLQLYRVGRLDVLKTYLDILHHADLRILARIQNPSRSRKFFVTLGKGIRRALVRRGLIVSHLGPVENPDLVSQIADFLLTYRDMDWAFCSGRYNGRLHVSFRGARPSVSASELLRDVFVDRGKAGGHDTIAGGSLRVGEQAPESDWREAERMLTERLLKRLRKSGKGRFYTPFRERKDMNPNG